MNYATSLCKRTWYILWEFCALCKLTFHCRVVTVVSSLYSINFAYCYLFSSETLPPCNLACPLISEHSLTAYYSYVKT